VDWDTEKIQLKNEKNEQKKCEEEGKLYLLQK